MGLPVVAVISRHWCPFQLQGVCRLAPGNQYPGIGLQSHPGTWLPGYPGTRLGGLPGSGLPACRSPRIRPLRVNSYKYSDGVVMLSYASYDSYDSYAAYA